MAKFHKYLKSPGSPTSPFTTDNPLSPGGPEQKNGDTVLIAMDGSEYSDYALRFYMESLHKPENHVIIVHSTEIKGINYPTVAMVGANTDMAVCAMSQEIQAEQTRSNEFVAKLTQRLNHLKIDGNVERIYGEPGPSILTVAKEQHVDYIVIGCRGKGSVRRTLTGSVTDYVSHHSPVPVMIARHKDHLKHYGFHLHNPFHRQKSHDAKSKT